MIELLRLSHRPVRDARLTTHIGLTSRAFLVDKMWYSGVRDRDMESSIINVAEQFGGNFQISYIQDPLALIKMKREEDFTIVHLTMYGKSFKENLSKVKNKNLLIIVGGEKVEPEFYHESDFNLSVTNQPISELSALAVFLHEFIGGKELNDNFNGKLKVIGQEEGKKVVKS